MIRAVPQTYQGIRFRSTLEADWACTLDAYRIAWQYEPEAIQLPRSGDFYRPDFYLPQIRTWLEVKGPHDERIGKPEELRWAVACPSDCDQCDSVDHSGYRDPWRMVVIGGPAQNGNRLKALVPWVSTAFALCGSCRHWQWSTWYYDGKCRQCGMLDALDPWACVDYNEMDRSNGNGWYGLQLHRVPRGRAA